MRFPSFLLTAALTLAFVAPLLADTNLIDQSWQHAAPREEIAPAFIYEPNSGRDGSASLVLQSDAREGIMGQWFKTVRVKGGQYYRFSVARKCDGVPSARRETPARIL